MYMYVYVRIYIYMYVCICMYMFLYMCIFMRMRTCKYMCMYMCMHTCICVCICICIWICMCISICLCIGIGICICIRICTYVYIVSTFGSIYISIYHQWHVVCKCLWSRSTVDPASESKPRVACKCHAHRPGHSKLKKINVTRRMLFLSNDNWKKHSMCYANSKLLFNANP